MLEAPEPALGSVYDVAAVVAAFLCGSSMLGAVSLHPPFNILPHFTQKCIIYSDKLLFESEFRCFNDVLIVKHRRIKKRKTGEIYSCSIIVIIIILLTAKYHLSFHKYST